MIAAFYFRKLLTTAEGNKDENEKKKEGKVRHEIKDVIKNGGSNGRFTNGGIFLYEENTYPLKQVTIT